MIRAAASTLTALAMMAGAALLARRGIVAASNEAQQADPFDPVLIFNNATEAAMSPMQDVDPSRAVANVAAFLLTIRHAEGTAGPNGYRTLFGGSLFDGYADHPRRAAQFTDRAGRKLWTTAAGAYQFLAVSPLPGGGKTRVDTWDRMQRRLGLPDFGPQSQDRAAVELIDEAGALDDVRNGRFEVAVSKVRRVWASLPGAGYAQPERTLADLSRVYMGAGGAFA